MASSKKEERRARKEHERAAQQAQAEARGAKRRTLLILVIGVAAVAVGVSGYLSWLYGQTALDPDVGAFCNISSTINCTDVVGSEYGHIWGISISTFGLAAYAVLGLLSLLALKPKNPIAEHAPAYVLLVGLGASLYSLYLLYIMQAELQALCVMCLTLDVLNFALFGLGIALVRNERMPVIGSLRDDWRYVNSKPSLLFASLAALILLSGALAFRYHSYTTVQTTNVKKQISVILDSPPVSFDSNGNPILPQGGKTSTVDLSGNPLKGNPNAAIGILEFADFRCPACKRGHEELKTLAKEHGDEFYLIFANFPLDIQCNPALTRQVHVNACEAASAALCAGEQDKYWEYNDALFTDQKKWVSADFRQYARSLGLDMDRFERCMVAPRTKAAIQRDVELALNLGVRATPTLFINGYKFPGSIDVEQFEALKEQLNTRSTVPSPGR